MVSTTSLSFVEAYSSLSEVALEQITGGGRRHRRGSSMASSNFGSGREPGAITNIFAQVNIAMIFVFGGENITIFNLQNNSSEGDFFFKLV